MEVSRRPAMTALLAVKMFGPPLLSLGLALVYLMLGLKTEGVHRHCYLTAAALYVGLAVLKLA
jgi:hypothetical protein